MKPYRKPTHTDRCRVASLPSTKTAINSLVHRAFTISDKEHLQTELNYLKFTSLTEKRTLQKRHNQNNR